MINKCKRCGRTLKNPESIKLGYGKTCYRIVNLQTPNKNITDEITFLKMEINMLKKQIRSIKSSGITPIERIKITEKDIASGERKNMGFVVSELKILFKNGDWRSHLRPIEPLSQIVAPPNLYS